MGAWGTRRRVLRRTRTLRAAVRLTLPWRGRSHTSRVDPWAMLRDRRQMKRMCDLRGAELRSLCVQARVCALHRRRRDRAVPLPRPLVLRLHRLLPHSAARRPHLCRLPLRPSHLFHHFSLQTRLSPPATSRARPSRAVQAVPPRAALHPELPNAPRQSLPSKSIHLWSRLSSTLRPALVPPDLGGTAQPRPRLLAALTMLRPPRAVRRQTSHSCRFHVRRRARPPRAQREKANPPLGDC